MANLTVLNKTDTVGFAYFLVKFYKENTNFLLILKDAKEIEFFSRDIKTFNPPFKNFFYFPHTIDPTHYIYSKTEALLSLVSERKGIIFVSDLQAFEEDIVSPERLQSSRVFLEKNAKFEREELIRLLEKFSYRRVEKVEERGEYSVRGGIIDLYPYGEEHPLRVEFWGNIIESLRIFSENTQVTLEKIKAKTIFLSSYNFSQDIKLKDLLSQIGKFDITMVKGQDLSVSVPSKEIYHFLPTFMERGRVVLSIDSPPFFSGKISLFLEELKNFLKRKYEIYLFLSTDGLIKRFEEILYESGVLFVSSKGFERKEGIVNITKGELSEGFLLKEEKIVVFTEREILGRKRILKSALSPESRRKRRIPSISEFSEGDYVVHKDYGIGIYRGLVRIGTEDGEREYIAIEYKDKDILYLSPQKLYLLRKYIGTTPVLNKLKGGDWKKVKEKAKKEAQEVARRLYDLYVERSKKKGFAFSEDTLWQRELELSFPYNETEDQLRALEEVKRDMEKDIPMDRIICGDVGYGKTEIAIRAAFKAVENGKQVAFLVPTTILASQHFESFRERLSPFPVEIEVLSRFRTQKDQKKIIKRLANGEIDIIIGTHRLLQNDVKFKDLGLLIIDEEQRFGVMHKERLKELKSDIDVLTLTATPIPRTLYMALTGIRDLSLITTPPENRLSIKTFVYKKSNKIIREAIMNEVSRGGQVFYVHNRIKDLEGIKANLEVIVPGIKVAIVHGQMDTEMLEDILMDFWEGKYDVLLTTTIIEIGIDFPNVNTIIIDDSYRYGLSQLYQLRGRVGRSHRRAYAYLLYPSYEKLTGNSKKRLEAIFEYQELGSGFNLALRDLEIRGAGSILGKSQHGYNDVGMELYSEFIREEISEIKNEGKEKIEREFDLGFDYYIPSIYIPSSEDRLYYYSKFSQIKSEEELKRVREELIDRFGRYKKEVRKIFDLVSLRLKAEKVGFDKIVKIGDKIELVKNKKEYKIDITGRDSQEILELIKKIIEKEIQNEE